MAKNRQQYPDRYPRRRQSYLQILIPMLLAAVLVGVGYWGWKQLMKPDTLPFRHIEIITKEAHLKPARLQKVALKNLRGGFFSLKVGALKQGLLAFPWVAKISLRRHWPDTLTVIVTEKKPVARWGEKGLMDDQGQVFFPSVETIPKDLPILKGPIGENKKILINYQKIRDASALLGLSIRSLEVSPRLSYRVVLSNGLVIIVGRQNIVQRFNRIVQLYPRLIGQKNAQVSYVDLRYPNGVAIKWKKTHKKRPII